MIYILDTADVKAIEHYNKYYPISGVTTNPSIIAKENTEFLPLLKKIRSIIGEEKMLCVQTLEKNWEGIVEDAMALKEEIGGNFCIKVPIGEAGLKATPILKQKGISVLMTAIFTPQQALISAKAGADYVAPYVNRLDNVVGDGTNVVAEIAELFDIYNLPCKVLAASFKNIEQVHKCSLAGCHCITVAPQILKDIITHPLTDVAIDGFDADWNRVYGDKKIRDMI